MERLKTYVQAAHFSLSEQEEEHVLKGAAALIELAERVPETPERTEPEFSQDVSALRPDEIAPQQVRPEDFAPATADGFIRVPRVLD